jgi:hypothetical protein
MSSATSPSTKPSAATFSDDFGRENLVESAAQRADMVACPDAQLMAAVPLGPDEVYARYVKPGARS